MGILSAFKKEIDTIKAQTHEIKSQWADIKATVNGEAEERKRQDEEIKKMVRNGENMPVIEPPAGIVLKKNEVCHIGSVAKYLETKTEKGLGYGGIRVRVTKGVSINTGSAKGIEHEVTKEVPGAFIITNQRLIFIPQGNAKGFNIGLNKIISYQIYKDGILLRTDAKNYTVQFDKKLTEMFETILIGALKNIE